MPDSYEGWHFLADNRRVACLQKPNGLLSPHAYQLVTPGLKLTVPGPIVPAQFGLHASQNPAEAVLHAPGLIVCRVRLTGHVVRADHYAAATERTVCWMADAHDAVWLWAIRCAAVTATRAERAGHSLDGAVWEAIAARNAWITAVLEQQCGQGDAIAIARAFMKVRGARNAARSAWLKADNRRNHGRGIKKTSGVEAPVLVREATAQAMRLVGTHLTCHRLAALRPPGWFDTEIGKLEGAALEKALLELPCKEFIDTEKSHG